MKQNRSCFLKRGMALLLAVVLMLSNVPLHTIRAHADDGNLITNGDFDTDITGWKGAPVGNATGTYFWEGGACKLQTQDAFGMESQVLIAVNPTGTYSLSYKADVSAGGVLYAYVDFYTAAGAASNMPYTRLSCTANGPVAGKKCSGEFKVPADTAQVSIRFELRSSQGETVTASIDDVKLYCEQETGSVLNAQNKPGLLSAYDPMQQKLLKMMLRATYPALGFRVDFADGEELPFSLWSGASVADGVMTQSADSNGYAEGTTKYTVDSSKTYILSSSINAVGRAQAVYWIYEYDENDNQIQTVPFTVYYSRGSGGFVDFIKEYTPSANTDYVTVHLQANEGRNRGGSIQWEYVSIWAEGEEPAPTEPETTEPETTEPETTEPETTEPETTEPETTAPAVMADFALNVQFNAGEALPWNLWSGASVANGVLTQSADSNGYAEGATKYAVDSSKTYVLSSRINAVGRAQAVYWVWEYDENGRQLQTIPYVAYYAGGSGGFVAFTQEYTPSQNTAYVLFHLQTNEGQGRGGSVQWDDVSVYVKGQEPETTEPETTEPVPTQPESTEPATTLPNVDVSPFEMYVSFADAEALPWTLWAGSTVANGVLTQSADADGYAQAAKPYTVEQGKTYNLSSKIHVSGRAQAIYWIWEFDASANQLATIPFTAFYSGGTNGWVDFNAEYTPSQNTAYVLFHLQTNEGQGRGGSVQWDDITVGLKGNTPDPTQPDTTAPQPSEPTTAPEVTWPEEGMPLNGDFEQGAMHWNFIESGTGTCVIEQTADGNVLKMAVGADGQAYTYCNQIPVKPNYVYTISYKIQVTPDSTENLQRYGAISVIQEFSDTGVTGHEQSGSARNVTDGWETVTYDFTTSATAKAIRLDIAYVNNPGVALIDDVTVVEKEEFNPEILDASYDHGGTDDTANPDNIITNSTFDQGEILGWTPKEGIAAVKTANENGGVVRFKVAPGRYLQSNELQIQGESEYELTYYVKVEDANNLEFISYFFTPQAGTWNDFLTNRITANTDGQWQKVQITFTTPVLEDGIKGFLGFKALHTQTCGWQEEQKDEDCNCGSSGTVYLDDISLVRKGEVVDLGDGKVTEDSLVLNGTFDLDQKYWDYLQSGDGVCSIGTENGNKFLQTYVKDKGQGYAYSQQMPVKPNYVYTVSYKVKVTPDSTENLLKYGAISTIQEFSDAGVTGYEQSTSARNRTDGWETITYDYITSATAKAIRLDVLYVNNPGVAQWDDFSIVEKEAYEPEILDAEYNHGGTKDTANPENIIANGTFDNGSIAGWSPKEGVAAVQTAGKNGGVVRFNVKPGIYMQSNEITVQGESEYELTYYVKVEDAHNLGFISYFFTEKSWHDFLDQTVTTNTDGQWQKVTIRFATPVLEEGVKGFLGFKALHTQTCGWQEEQKDEDCNCGSSGTVYLDDISLIRKGEVVDLGDGKVTEDSLVLNGTFDLDQKYWDYLQSGDGVCSIGTENGNKFLQTCVKDKGQGYAYSQQMPVKPNYVYTVSYKVKVTPDSTENLLKYGAISTIQEFSDAGVTGYEQSTSARNRTDGWETITYEYITSATAKAIRLDVLYVNNPGMAQWDDFSIVEKEAYEPEVLDAEYNHGGTKDTANPENIIANGTFDNGSIAGWSPKEGVAAVQTAGKNGGVVRFNVKPGIYMQSNEITVQGESEYELTYYVKVEDAHNLGFISYFFTEKSWHDFLDQTVTTNTDGQWQKVTIRFATPVLEEGVKGFLGFKALHTQTCGWQEAQKDEDCNCGSSGTVYLDDISLIRKGYAEDKGDGKVTADSLVLNGTFDLDQKYWDYIQSGDGVCSIETENGNKVLQTKLRSEGQAYAYSQQMPVKPNYVYTITYKVKVTPDSTENLLKYGAISTIQEFSDAGVTGYEQSASARNRTDGWETITYDYITSATAKAIRLDVLYVNNPGVAQWDDFSIVEKEAYEPEVLPKKYDHGGTEDTANPENIITNGTFDNGSIAGWSPKEGVAAVQTAGKNGGVVRFNVKPGIYMQSNELTVQGESEYELTYYVKVEDAHNLEFISYFFTEKSWNDFLDQTVTTNTDGQWQKVTIRFATPVLEEGVKGFLGFKALHTQTCGWQKAQKDEDCNCGSSGTVYLDDISLIRKGYAEDKGDGKVSEDSLVLNGTFDLGNKFWDFITNGESAYNIEETDAGNVLKMTIGADGQVYAYSQQIPVKPNYVYTVTYKVKVTPDSKENLLPYGAIAIIQEFSGSGATGHEQSSTARNITDGWETITFEYKTSSTAEFIRLDFQYVNNAGCVWWDDFSIVEKEAYEPEVLPKKYDHGGTEDTANPENIIVNGTFDNGSITGWSPKEGVAAVQTANKNGGVVRFNVKPGIYMQSNELTVQGESEYELTYYVKVEDADNLEFISYFFTAQEGTWKDFLSARVEKSTNGKWQKVQVRFVTPVLEEGVKGFVGFKVIHTQACAWQQTQNDADCTCNASGTVYLDDISLIRKGEAEDIGNGYASEGSILYNGSFDRYFTDKYMVDGWTMNELNPNHDTYIQKEVARSGNAISINATGHSYIWAADFSVEAGNIYILSYWVKVDQADGLKFAPYMNDANYNGGWWLDDAATPIYDVTDGWVKISSPVSIPASVGSNPKNPDSKIQLGFQVYEGSGVLYLDDVSLVKTDIDANNPNLDFELSSEILYNWSSASFGGKGTVTTSDVVRPGGDSKVSASVFNGTNDGNTILISQNLPVEPKTTYEFSYWVRIDGNYDSSCTPHFRQIAEDGVSSATSLAWDGNNQVTVQSEMISPFWLYQLRGNIGWRQISMSVTTGPNTHFLQLRMTVMGENTYTYIDDVTLEKTVQNVNLDFELTSSVTGAPMNWYLSGGGSNKMVSEADTTMYHSGKQSYHIVKDSLMERSVVDSCAFIPVDPGKTYEFSFWMSSKNCAPTATIRMNMQLYTADGTRIYMPDGNYRTMQGTVASLNSSDQCSPWTKVTTRAKPVSEAAYATISFAITRGDAEVWIDDIFVNVVEDDVDCVVYYDDFHAVDQDGNTGDWTLDPMSGEAAFTSGNGGKLTVTAGESGIYTEMKQIMTGYSYTVKGNYTADMGGKVEMRFYDYHHKELEDSRVEMPILADEESLILSFTAPSCAYTRLYISSDQAGTIEMKDVTVYMVAKPANSSDWDALWVWYPENPVDDAVEEYRFFRYTFTLEDDVEYAPLQLTVDDKYAFYLNGELIDDNWDASQDSWADVASYDLTDKVKKGENIIALKCYNLVSEAAVLFDGKFTLKNQSTAIVASNANVVSAKQVDETTMDWVQLDYDDSGWTGCKEYGQPPCSPWGPVFYNSTLYINNVAQVISTTVPETVTAGRDLVFTMTLKLENPIEANFTPTVTVYKRNSISSITSVPLTLETYDKPLQWPVGEAFEVQCRVSIPDYMESGKYTLQMDENMLLLTGDGIYDNKFLDFKAVETSSSRDNVVSSVEVYNGVPTLIIDGEPVASHFYLRPDLNVYLQTDAETRIYKSELELYITYGGGLYKGGCDPIWLEDGSIDYDAFDSVIYETLAASNDALVMVHIGMFAPPWWIEQNPDHELLCHNGSQYIAIDGEVSLASEKFREEAGEVLRLLIRHMKEQSYYNRVYGLKISGGQSYEWMIRGTGSNQGPDYSPISVEGFKKYLKKIYGTEEQLQKAWGNSSVTFENAAAPGWDERNSVTNVYSGDADTGYLCRNIVDWNLYLNEASADTFLYYCQIAKEETDNQIIVGGYNGYLWTSNSYDSQGMAHTAMNRVLNSEYVDWIASPVAYNERLLGESNTYMPLLDSVQEHGKLYIAEQDNRTVLSSAYAGAPWDADWDFSIGQSRTIADTISQQKRDFANALVNGAGLWQYDMYGGWLDDDQIYQYIAEAKAEYDYSVYLDRDVRHDVAIFVGDETYAYIRAGEPNMPYTLLEPMLMQQRKHLAAMGTGYDTYAMSSLLDGKVAPHKINIIFSPFEITAEMNEAIDKYLKCNGQYVVWVYLPGISDGSKLDPDFMKRVTGFDIGVIEEKSGLQVQIAETNNVLTKGIEGLIYGNSTPNSVSPMPYIKNTAGVEVLGYNLDNNQGAGLGIKDMGEWVSIYSAAPCLDVALLRNLLKLADCHIYSENNEDVIYASNRYVALHSATAEQKTIKLPGTYAVYDVFEKQFISMETDTITYAHQTNDTHIFRLMTPNTYAVTARIKAGKGTVSAPGLTEVAPGDSYSLTVTPNEGYEIASVMVNGEEAVLTENRLDIASVDGNTVIEVKFNKLPEMVEVIEYVQELIILPWPAAIGILAVFTAAVWGITKGVKALRRKAEEEGGY